MTAQTSYSRNPSAAFAGMKGDARDAVISSRLNGESSANFPAGVFAAQSTEGKALLIAAATDKLAGVVLNSFARNPGDIGLSLSATEAYAPKALMPVLEEGSAWVVCEEAMATSDDVYVRFSTNGTGKLIVGAVRNDPDGVAQVSTVTPTAASSTLYQLEVELSNGKRYTFTYNSDGSATATEICDGFRTLLAADTAVAAEITGSGTATLILTGATAGKSFTATSGGPGVMAVAATTPPAAHCRLVRGARVDTSSSAAGVCKIVFDLPAELAAAKANSQ